MLILGVTFLTAMLIPQVSTHTHRGGAIAAATRAQYSNYINALELFRGEYKDYPSIFDDNGELHLSVYPNSQLLIEALSGLNGDGESIAAHGNHRAIRFYSFAESEVTSELGFPQIIDRAGNSSIVICVDHDNDGVITVLYGDEREEIRARVTAYSLDKEGKVVIKMWH